GVFCPDSMYRIFDPRCIEIRIGSHIRQTIQHKCLCLFFDDKIYDFFLQGTIARKAKIDDWNMQIPFQNIGPCHTRSRSTSSLRNGSTVYDYRLAIGYGKKFKFLSFTYTDFQPLYIIVQGQVKMEYPS